MILKALLSSTGAQTLISTSVFSKYVFHSLSNCWCHSSLRIWHSVLLTKIFWSLSDQVKLSADSFKGPWSIASSSDRSLNLPPLTIRLTHTLSSSKLGTLSWTKRTSTVRMKFAEQFGLSFWPPTGPITAFLKLYLTATGLSSTSALRSSGRNELGFSLRPTTNITRGTRFFISYSN